MTSKSRLAKSSFEYLQTNYFTIERLALLAGTSAREIVTLQEHRCFPAPSYTIILSVALHTNISGKHSAKDDPIGYYHPSTLDILMSCLEEKAKQKDYSSLALVVQNEFNASVLEYSHPKEENVDKFLQQSWDEYLSGTYGVCLRIVSPKNMIIKQKAVYKLKLILESEKKGAITREEFDSLGSHLKVYNDVAAPFSPLELENTSRGKTYNTAKLLYENLENRFTKSEKANTSLRILSNEEKALAEKFWYEVCVTEMGRSQQYQNDLLGTICDPLQVGAVIIGAFQHEELVGTVRVNFPDTTNLGYYEDLYSLQDFKDFLPDKVAVSTRIVVASRFRGTNIGLTLASAMFHYLAERGIEWVLCNCNQGVLPFFDMLGFETYKKALHPDYGQVSILSLNVTKVKQENPPPLIVSSAV